MRQLDELKIQQMLDVMVERQRGICHELGFSNPFAGLLIRKGKIIQEVYGHNGVTIVGKNHMLDVTFGNATPVTQVDPWYIGLVNNSPAPTFAEADTLASHSGWSEFTDYSGNRQAWDDADAASKVKGASAVSSFTMTGAGVINGIFVAAAATGTSGVLWATGSFDSTVTVVSTDILKVSYGVRM